VNVLPEDVKVWVKERKPKTSEEAGRLVEDYRQARKPGKLSYSHQGPSQLSMEDQKVATLVGR